MRKTIDTWLRHGCLVLVGTCAACTAPDDNGSSIVAFHHGMDPDKAQEVLTRANVKVSFREEGTQIRAGAALFNNKADIDRFLEAMETLASA